MDKVCEHISVNQVKREMDVGPLCRVVERANFGEMRQENIMSDILN